MTSLTADQLAPDGAPAACLRALRDATGEPGSAMERHCVRVFAIAERLAADTGWRVDREALLCAALLHDVGIYDSVATHGEAYVTEGRRAALDVVAPFHWSEARRRLLGDAIEQHHAQTKRDHLGHEVEVIRRADLVDASSALLTFGLPRPWLRGLHGAVPRRGYYALLAGAALRILREQPLTYVGVFRPPLGGRAVQDG